MSKKKIDEKYFEESEESINIRAILEQYLYYWKWFILGIFVALIVAFVYIKYTQKQYQVSAKILLNEKESSTGELAGLMDQAMLGSGSGGNADVGDQIEILKSKRLLTKVVKQNNLNIQYFSKGRVAEVELTQENSPIKIIFLNEIDKAKDDLRGLYIVRIKSSTKFILINKQNSTEK